MKNSGNLQNGGGLRIPPSVGVLNMVVPPGRPAAAPNGGGRDIVPFIPPIDAAGSATG